MKMVILAVAVAFVLAACAAQQVPDVMIDKGSVEETTVMQDDVPSGDAMKNDAISDVVMDTVPSAVTDVVAKEDGMINDYEGTILAGSQSPYLTFTKGDYDKAVSQNKTILLYFYANWCPICVEEQQHVVAAFDSLDDIDVIGFRVNYRDSDTDAGEEAIAKQYGVAYQHTKVVLRPGTSPSKSPESWDKDRYLSELAVR